jgi:DNA-binding NtrC family response regulator
MENILLIDDNEEFRELFKISLEHAGIHKKLLEAKDPLEGLAIFNKNSQKIRIVISDFYMPVQNGNDFLEIIKSHDSSIYCCLLTGDGSLAQKKFPNVDKVFAKENLNNCIDFLKNIDWRRE